MMHSKRKSSFEEAIPIPLQDEDIPSGAKTERDVTIESDPQKKSSDDKKHPSATGNGTNSFITVTLNGSPSDS